MLRGLALFRWGAWAWMAIVVVLNRSDLEHPWVAWCLVGAALVVTVVTTLTATADPQRLLAPHIVIAELVLGALLQFGGGWAYGSDPFSSAHSIGSAWPLVGVLSAGTAWGAVRGGITGGALGAVRVLQPLAAGLAFSDVERSQWFSVASSMILYVLAGAISGHVADLLRRLERDISAARARDEVARTLHDGVLQTLAIIERRVDDQELARLAREQERDLREYLFGIGAAAQSGGARDVGPALRAAAATFEDRFAGRAHVVLAPDLPTFAVDRVDALAGAVSEALTNAGKHGDASAVYVYVEPDEDAGGVLCSVRDDGLGFDVTMVNEGIGLRRSIRERISEVGGRVEIESRPGGGTEVRLWLPS